MLYRLLPRSFFGRVSWGCHGDDESDVYKELCRIVEENIALYKEDAKTLPPSNAGKEYSGKFFLNVGKDLHKLLSIKSLQAGKSFNNYCVNLLQ
jgi:predicted HicB family RNase H-like nuclease